LEKIQDNAPEGFHSIVSTIRERERDKIASNASFSKKPRLHSKGIREFGMGLNTAMSIDRPVSSIVAFERQAGFHVSIGDKHTVFSKPGISKRKR